MASESKAIDSEPIRARGIIVNYLVILPKGAMFQLWAAQKDLFLSSVFQQPLCFDVVENCSNLTFKSQSQLFFSLLQKLPLYNCDDFHCFILHPAVVIYYFHISNCSVSLAFAAPLKQGTFWLTPRESGTGRRAKKTETYTLYIATETKFTIQRVRRKSNSLYEKSRVCVTCILLSTI